MKLMSGCIVLMLSFFAEISYSRNPFIIEQKNIDSCNLRRWLPEDLTYLGTVSLADSKIAFVADPLQHLCQVYLGDRLGNNHWVVDVRSDQVVLTDGQLFSFLK